LNFKYFTKENGDSEVSLLCSPISLRFVKVREELQATLDELLEAGYKAWKLQHGRSGNHTQAAWDSWK
jgi:hypothetical protein